jgi:dTDP-4-dehydrorhamnose 3,5-epimerase
MKIIHTPIQDVLLLEPSVFEDPRGYFFEAFNKRTLQDLGIAADFVQDNISLSKHNVLRGLHYQIEEAQGKLVRALAGQVFDVAVDLRVSSPTFGKWFGEVLTGANRKSMWIPPGFAHGFVVLSDEALFSYKTTAYYAPQFERTILWNDSDLMIKWPISSDPVLSKKDREGVPFARAEYYQTELVSSLK